MAQPTNYRQMVLDTITHALTSDPNPEVRAKAAESLGKLGEAIVTPLLLNALSDSNQTVQCSIIQALGQLGDESAVPKLLEVLETGTMATRQTAAEALGLIRLHSKVGLPHKTLHP
jgi:HEAT repeat protein